MKDYSERKKMKEEKEVPERFKGLLDEMEVEYSEVILFGSRAQEESEKDSDWDFLVILKRSASSEAKKKLWVKIYKKFHECFPFTSVDIILKDADSFEKEKTVANTTSNEVYLEGVQV
ncbi:MAG: nucleotidyltransferase domain-containing protein [Euryarchaeota archaeon]|nr:nucleotidyltransferase domain-containing protein [Euryarchaeota archaeon]